ncbi:hypothetical protein LguiB_012804 [Lonicera macranthoides]
METLLFGEKRERDKSLCVPRSDVLLLKDVNTNDKAFYFERVSRIISSDNDGFLVL